jgi:hypothetical protein
VDPTKSKRFTAGERRTWVRARIGDRWPFHQEREP